MCPYSEFLWSAFSRMRSVSLYSAQMRENTYQKNSENGHFSRSVKNINVLTIRLKMEYNTNNISLIHRKCEHQSIKN